MKIDAVITWVDGDDPRHRARRELYGGRKFIHPDDVAGNTRFSSLGEIFYCVASLNKFAPWLNKIYIVTDEQNPNLEAFLAEHFPAGYIPMEIVDHKVIFEGYEEYLPTFNSMSIESMTWRIPGLSERYIEFNDDLILAAPTRPEDFFTEDGKVVCYGKKYRSLYVMLSHMLKRHGDGSKQVSYRQTMLNAANLLGKRSKFIKIYHTPKALLRSIYVNSFAQHPEHLTNNIRHRFREPSQYNVEELHYIIAHREGRCVIRRAYDELLYLKPKRSVSYITEKLSLFDKCPNHKFGCFNSIDQMTEWGQRNSIEWSERRFGLR